LPDSLLAGQEHGRTIPLADIAEFRPDHFPAAGRWVSLRDSSPVRVQGARAEYVGVTMPSTLEIEKGICAPERNQCGVEIKSW